MSYIFSKNNLYINFEEFENGNSNVCFITGLSGSGKSTLGETLSKKHKAEYIELDIFEHSYMFENDNQLKEAGDVFYQYLSKHKDIKEKLKTKSIQGKELGVEIDKFLKFVLSYVNKNKDRKFIVEGVQIYAFCDPKVIKRYPLILIQTSMSKSIKQRWLRNGAGKIEWKEELKELPPLLKWYLGEEKEFTKFKKAIIKEECSMNFEGLAIIYESISQYKQIPMTEENIKKYKSKTKGLSHIRTGKDYTGTIILDNENVVGFYNLRVSDRYIQALEVSEDYQSKGIGNQLLQECVRKGAIRLSVNKKNEKAINLYKKRNFKIVNEDNTMYYMELNKKIHSLKESYNSIQELNEDWIKYSSQSFKDILKAEEKSIEEFGLPNKERYLNIFNDLSTRMYLDVNVDESQSLVNQDYVNKINYESAIDMITCLPYFTPQELEDIIFKEGVEQPEWFQEYKLLQNGILTNRFIELNKERLNELYENIYSDSDTVLKLGWSPNIPLTAENLENATINTSFRLKSSLYTNKIYDATNIVGEDDFIEESTRDNKNPIYVILVYTASPFGKMIKKYTHGIYTHAAMSLDNTLNKLYSFNLNNEFNKLGGFSIESIEGYKKDNKDAIMCVYTTFVNDEKKRKLDKQINYFIGNIDKTKYSILNVFSLIANKPIELANDMICSQFVDRMLKSVDIDVTGMASSLVTPNDIYKSTSTKIYKIYEGRVDEYNHKKAQAKVNKLKRSHITEAKSAPIQFDKDGNLLIVKNMKDIQEEYNKSHKLLLSYDSSGNIEGMKHELYKLWYLNLILERKIYKNKKPEKEYHDMRARILNDFNKYLKVVNKHEPDFVFTDGYEQSPYTDASIRINSNTIKYGVKYTKSLFKLFENNL